MTAAASALRARSAVVRPDEHGDLGHGQAAESVDDPVAEVGGEPHAGGAGREGDLHDQDTGEQELDVVLAETVSTRSPNTAARPSTNITGITAAKKRDSGVRRRRFQSRPTTTAMSRDVDRVVTGRDRTGVALPSTLTGRMRLPSSRSIAVPVRVRNASSRLGIAQRELARFGLRVVQAPCCLGARRGSRRWWPPSSAAARGPVGRRTRRCRAPSPRHRGPRHRRRRRGPVRRSGVAGSGDDRRRSLHRCRARSRGPRAARSPRGSGS